MTLAPAKPITVEEFDRFVNEPGNLERKLQLVNGEIIEAMPKYAHTRITTWLIIWLAEYLKAHSAGKVFNEFRVELPGDDHNARVPDICVVIDHEIELATLEDDDALPFMPDLIIEVQSKGQSDRYMLDLATYYLNNGCRMVWLIYPDRKLVEWLTPTERRLLTAEDTINGGDVFPDLSLAVTSIFAAK